MKDAKLEQERLFPRMIKRIYKDEKTPTNQWEAIPPMLPEICIGVKMSCNGAADPWANADLVEVIEMLELRLQQWHPSTDRMDQLVHSMVEEAIGWAKSELASRESRGVVYENRCLPQYQE